MPKIMKRIKRKIGYKKAINGYIVKLMILGENNEDLYNKLDSKLYIKYRCSKAKVLDIFHCITGKIINEIPSIYDGNFIYKINEIVREPNYSKEKHIICGKGIHYFRTKEQAKYWELHLENYTGEFKRWDNNGKLLLHCYYKDGERDGEYKEWMFGKLFLHCYYKDGKKDGEFKKYNLNEKLILHCYYKDDKLNGEYKEWDNNGKLMENYWNIVTTKMIK